VDERRLDAMRREPLKEDEVQNEAHESEEQSLEGMTVEDADKFCQGKGVFADEIFLSRGLRRPPRIQK
jgi:hypothetical protein